MSYFLKHLCFLVFSISNICRYIGVLSLDKQLNSTTFGVVVLAGCLHVFCLYFSTLIVNSSAGFCFFLLPRLSPLSLSFLLFFCLGSHVSWDMAVSHESHFLDFHGIQGFPSSGLNFTLISRLRVPELFKRCESGGHTCMGQV